MRKKSDVSTFQKAVKAIVTSIPRGKTLSYGEVARQAGNAKAARAVASIMSQNFDPNLPCHRVIYSTGKVGPYNRGGEVKKRALLISEGWQETTHLGK